MQQGGWLSQAPAGVGGPTTLRNPGHPQQPIVWPPIVIIRTRAITNTLSAQANAFLSNTFPGVRYTCCLPLSPKCASAFVLFEAGALGFRDAEMVSEWLAERKQGRVDYVLYRQQQKSNPVQEQNKAHLLYGYLATVQDMMHWDLTRKVVKNWTVENFSEKVGIPRMQMNASSHEKVGDAQKGAGLLLSAQLNTSSPEKVDLLQLNDSLHQNLVFPQMNASQVLVPPAGKTVKDPTTVESTHERLASAQLNVNFHDKVGSSHMKAKLVPCKDVGFPPEESFAPLNASLPEKGSFAQMNANQVPSVARQVDFKGCRYPAKAGSAHVKVDHALPTPRQAVKNWTAEKSHEKVGFAPLNGKEVLSTASNGAKESTMKSSHEKDRAQFNNNQVIDCRVTSFRDRVTYKNSEGATQSWQSCKSEEKTKLFEDNNEPPWEKIVGYFYEVLTRKRKNTVASISKNKSSPGRRKKAQREREVRANRQSPAKYASEKDSFQNAVCASRQIMEQVGECGECAICMDNFNGGNRGLFMPCGHAKLCMACANEVYREKKSCPFCSKAIEKEPILLPSKLYM